MLSSGREQVNVAVGIDVMTELSVPRRLKIRLGYFEHELSDILAFEELQQCVWKCFEAFDDVLARFEFAGSHPPGHFAPSLGITISVVKYHHPFHAGAIYEQ
jgi:hypothetical protein